MSETLPSVEEIAETLDNHDPATCGDPTCAEVPEGSDWLTMGMSVDPSGRVRFHHHAESRMHLRVYREQAWNELCEQYAANPADFVTAYQWLENHPIFHRFNPGTGDGTLPADPTERARVIAEVESDDRARIADNGLKDAWVSVFHATTDDHVGPAGPRVLIEHGPHLWASDHDDEWTTAGGCSSHDPNVDAIGATYEEAIVGVAKNVAAHYGNDRAKVRTSE